MSAPQNSMSSSSSLNTGSARKRPWPRHAERSAALNLSLETSPVNKRQKTLSLSASADNNTTFTQSLPTPPKSATAKGSNTNNTIRLKLEIPKPEISKEDKRTIKIRQAAAERWVPKLQNPFPNNREIKEAYQCKLLRHYTTPTTTGDQQAPAPEPAEIIKPQINRSARVDKLLKQFPLLSTPSSNNQISTMTFDQDVELDYQRNVLAYNKAVISSEKAQKLAWKAFSKREKGWIGSVREDMVVSGLPEEDLEREKWRLPNRLPEWCKAKTGKFAKEK